MMVEAHGGRSCARLARHGARVGLLALTLVVACQSAPWEVQHQEADHLLRRAIADSNSAEVIVAAERLAELHQNRFGRTAAASDSLLELGYRLYLVGVPETSGCVEDLLRRSAAVREHLRPVDPAKVDDAMGTLAAYLYQQDRFADAESVESRMLALLTQPDVVVPPELLHSVRSRYAKTLLKLDRHDEAIDQTLAKIDWIRAQTNPDTLAWCDALNSCGEAARLAGRYEDAAAFIARGTELITAWWQRNADRRDEVDAIDRYSALLLAAGGVAYDRGQMTISRERCEQVRQLTEGVEGLASRHAVAVMSLADLERLRRNYRGAQEMAPMVEELAETAFPPGSAENWAFYSFLAELATETGDVETARHHYDAVIRRLEAVPRYGRAHLPFLLRRRAWLENDAGNRDAARRDLERAAALLPFDRDDPHPLAATVASDLVLLGTDATFAEVRRLEEADAVLSRSSAFLPERARIRMARAELLQRRGNARQAIELMESGLADVEVLRRGIAADGLVRAVYQASHADAYGDLARWHHALDEDEAALRAIERGRARSLEESMAERHRVAEGKNPDRLSSLHRRVRAAQSEYSALRRRLRSAHASALHADQQDSALTRLEEQTAAAFEGIQEAREAWRRELYRSPADAKGKGTRLPALTQLREALAPGQALLMYHVGTRHCDAYLVDPLEDRIHHTSLIVSPEDADRLGIRQGPLTRAKLRRLVGPGDPILDSTATGLGETSGLIAALRAGHWRDPRLRSAIDDLSRVLLPEDLLRRLRSVRSLVLVLDSPLQALPFETLTWSRDPEPITLLEGGPAVTYCPSASVFLRLRGESERWDRPVVVVADPAFEGRPSRDARRSVMNQPLQRLPGTRAEGEHIRRSLRQVELYAGARATESVVRERAPEAGILHLATHGLVAQIGDHVTASLVLSPGAGTSADDGFLDLHEIGSLRLDSDLVVLSACDTHRGRTVAGEGVVGLSREFLAAGARRVVATLWPVGDRSTQELMKSFYAEIAESLSADRSPDLAHCLREAKRALAERRGPHDRARWAPFVLVGVP